MIVFFLFINSALAVIDSSVREANLRAVTFTITKGVCNLKATDYQCCVYREFNVGHRRLSEDSVTFSMDALNLFEILKRAKSKKAHEQSS